MEWFSGTCSWTAGLAKWHFNVNVRRDFCDESWLRVTTIFSGGRWYSKTHRRILIADWLTQSSAVLASLSQQLILDHFKEAVATWDRDNPICERLSWVTLILRDLGMQHWIWNLSSPCTIVSRDSRILAISLVIPSFSLEGISLYKYKSGKAKVQYINIKFSPRNLSKPYSVVFELVPYNLQLANGLASIGYAGYT